MKILIVPSWYTQPDNPISGIFFREQALALKEIGLDVTVMVPEIQSIKKPILYPTMEFEDDEGLMTYRMKTSYYIPKVQSTYANALFRIADKMYKKIVEEQGVPDIIHAHSILWGGWIGAELSKKYNIPLAVTEHSTAYSRGLIVNKQVKFINKTLKQANKIISVGPGLKKDLEKYTNQNIMILPNIVDVDSMIKNNHLDNDKNNTFVFFTLGLLTQKKGMDDLIKAFAKYKTQNKNIDIELWIGGDGEDKNKLESLSYSLGIDKNIRFLGMLSRNEVFDLMKRINIFVLASRHETFGVVFIEALAAGKPIIATKSGGPDNIVNEKNGLLVEVGDIDEIAEAMSYMKNNYNQYDSNEIIRDCKEKYSKQAVCNQLISIYESMLS